MSSVARARTRQPQGISTGGQFAAETKPEANGVILGVASVRPAPDARNLLDAMELKEVADLIRQRHPQAVEFAPTFDEDDASITYRNADGTTGFADMDGDDDPMFTGAGNVLASRLADNKGFIPLEHVDQEHEQSVRLNDPAGLSHPHGDQHLWQGLDIDPIQGVKLNSERKYVDHLAEDHEVATATDDHGNTCDIITRENGLNTLSPDLSDSEAWRTDLGTGDNLESAICDTLDQSRTEKASEGAGLRQYGHAFEVHDVERGGGGEWTINYRAEDGSEEYEIQWSPIHDLKITTIDGLDMTDDAPTVAEDILGRNDGDAEAFFRDAEARYQAGGAA